ncbi:hypothetical protein AB4Y90_18075, partial [Chryseobacterium sp. 2TAF14]|uniref:hypothetical protein n=1 Tax=Chryseobacterium sp. 2TAF14 TaxID=3233007 RepID=UPI003F8FBBF3
MSLFQQYIPLFSKDWKEKYHSILAEEHLQSLDENIHKFKAQTLNWDLPFFNEEIQIDCNQSFNIFTHILELEYSDEIKVQQLEEIPFELWLNILGQRLTSASLRDENAIPPLKSLLIQACEKPFNNEITIAQRAWEKHAGRMEDRFWG